MTVLSLATGDMIILNLPLKSVWIRANALSGGACAINGPAHATNGGFFLYGFTVSDYDYASIETRVAMKRTNVGFAKNPRCYCWYSSYYSYWDHLTMAILR